MPIVDPGAKLLVVTRRLFESDLRRHFAGEVVGVTEYAVRLCGFAFIFDGGRNQFVRRPEERTRLFSLMDNGCVFFVLPRTVEIGALKYVVTNERTLAVTDSGSFALDINEFGAGR